MSDSESHDEEINSQIEDDENNENEESEENEEGEEEGSEYEEDEEQDKVDTITSKKEKPQDKFNRDEVTLLGKLKKGSICLMSISNINVNQSQATQNLHKSQINNQTQSQNELKYFKVHNTNDKSSIKLRSEENGEIVSITPLDANKITTNKIILLHIITHTGKFFQVNIIADINSNFDHIKTQFCKRYSIPKDKIAIIFNGKRLSPKELTSTEIYSKNNLIDTSPIIIAIGQLGINLLRLEAKFQNVRIKTEEKRSMFMFSNSPISIYSFFFTRSAYGGNAYTISSFEVYEVPTEESDKYLLKQKSAKKSKLAKLTTKKLQQQDLLKDINLDTLFQKLEKNKELLSIDKRIAFVDNIVCEHNDSNSSFDEDIPFHEYKSKYCEVEVDCYFQPKRLYYLKLILSGNEHQQIKCERFEKGKKMFSSEDSNIILSVFLEKKHKESLISGLLYKQELLFQ
jgi:hypothetical protein